MINKKFQAILRETIGEWNFKTKEKYNEGEWQHPELREGEILFINVKDAEDWSKVPSFLEYLRHGEIAYTTGGKEVVPDMKPLFGKLK
jgi:hypothetical protein